MGSDRGTRTGLVTRCCHGASFGFGFILTVLTLVVMFWIAWCYFGLTIVHFSDTQRRAIVNYSFIATKPSPTPTSSPVRSTTSATEETSANSISKLPTTATVLRGASRGESPTKVDKKKEPVVVSNIAKGDFASRDRPVHVATASETHGASPALSPPRGPPRTNDEPIAGIGQKADILSGTSSEESDDDRIYARRVLPPGVENRPDETSESDKSSIRRSPQESNPDSRPAISPTKVFDIEAGSGSSRRPQDAEADRKSIDDGNTQSRDYIDRAKTIPTRRDDKPRSDPESGYRDPDFDREYPRRYAAGTDRERSKYDDLDDERGSRSRYDKRDRGRDTDDLYSKGDTRVYTDARPPSDDRYRVRERYPEDSPKRGDDGRYDDRYRDYDERPRYRDRDIDTRYSDKVAEDRPPIRDDRYRDKIVEERPPIRDDRFRDKVTEDRPPIREDRYRDQIAEDRPPVREDRYKVTEDGPRPRDDRYRDDDRYRPRSEDRDDDRYRPREEDRYRSRGDDRYRTRDEDRYRDDDKYVPRADGRPVPRDDDRYVSRDIEDRRVASSRYKDEKEPYRPRVDEVRSIDLLPSRSRDDDLREPVSRAGADLPVADERKGSPSRAGYELRKYDTVTDYDVGVRDRPRSYEKDDVNPSRLARPPYKEDRYRDDERRPSRYEDEVRISPTKTRVEDALSWSTSIDSRPKERDGDARYPDDERSSRKRDDRYADSEIPSRNTRIQDSRGSLISSESSRRLTDDRDAYRTRLPNERTENDKVIDRREEVVLDRRSYASEEDEYRRADSRRDYDYEDRSRTPADDTRRRFRDEEKYVRRDPIDDEEYKRGRTRESPERDRTRSRDRYSDEDRRYDDKYDSRDDDRYTSRDERPPPLPMRKYDAYPDEEERIRRRDPEPSTVRKEDSSNRERVRSVIPSRSEDRYYPKDEYPESKPYPRRRYDDDLPVSDSRDYKDDYTEDRRRSGPPRQPVSAKDSIIGSSMTSVYSREPSEVVVREKRFQTSDTRHQNSRVSAMDEFDKERSYLDSGSKSEGEVRPLTAKDVIDAAMRHPDTSSQNRKVYYPVFDPRVSNLTSPELIRPSERRGTTITAKRRRSI